jgi:hypothetical protein
MIREALMAALANQMGTNEAPQADNQAPQDGTPDVGKIKEDWNDFLGWMEQKGLKGNPELDKNDLGNKYFKQYIKDHPETSLSEEVIPVIRDEYSKLRDTEWNDIIAGKSYFQSPIGNITGKAAEPYRDKHMYWIAENEKSKNKNYVGQFLTKTYFPGAKNVKTKEGDRKSAKIITPEFIEKSAPMGVTKTLTVIPSKSTPIQNMQNQ